MSRYLEVIDLLSDSASPIISYKTLVNVLGTAEDEARVQSVRRQIKTWSIATSLLADLSRSRPTDRGGINTI